MSANDFDPSAPGINNGNYFGLSFSTDEALIVLISVPWDVTTSYRNGTSDGPAAILEASLQVDLYDADFGEAWMKGIASLPFDKEIEKINKKNRKKSKIVIEALTEGKHLEAEKYTSLLKDVNCASEKLNKKIYKESSTILSKQQIPGIIGGEHSVPLGLIKAIADKYNDFGILHIDAHADLRQAYEGFEYSHASIMYHASKIPQLSKLVQVGLRDFSLKEKEFAESMEKILWYNDSNLQERLLGGNVWSEISAEIVQQLPQNVYLSFDIDGLEPSCCPSTGTPVPGGLNFMQAIILLKELKKQSKKIIGFDLCEVAPGNPPDIDAIFGTRMLFKICNLICSL